MPSEFWDEQVVVEEIETGAKRKIVVSRVRKDGRRYVDVRAFYPDRAKSGSWLPGKGLSIPEEAAQAVCEAIGKANMLSP